MPETLSAWPDAPILSGVGRWMRVHLVRILCASAAILIPCFWHYEIAASDLGSHLYNAWLAQLIRRGQLPGLWIAPQRTNVLFDWLLGGLGSLLSLPVAERLAVSLAVLIFFWGLFALVSAAARRAPWFLAPVLALITYGWTFHLGLFNYYLSLGLSFFAIALVWQGKGWERLAALPIALLVWCAHPLGFFWLLGASAFILCRGLMPERFRVCAFAIAVAGLWGLHVYLSRRYPLDPGASPFYAFNGADQLVLFGERYRWIARTLLALAVVALGTDVISRRRVPGAWRIYALALEFYVLAEIAVLLLPEAVALPPPAVKIALLTERLTLVSAALGCCLLGIMRPIKWHLAASAAIAVVFFLFLYQDTAAVNRMEARVEQLVSTLPPSQRVMGTILPPPGSRILLQHILDRACIGRCFSYGNYEPSTGVFRVRALPGNPYVLSDYGLAVDMEQGGYVVQPRDLPVYQIYQCSSSGEALCLRSLEAGEVNDRLGEHAER